MQPIYDNEGAVADGRSTGDTLWLLAASSGVPLTLLAPFALAGGMNPHSPLILSVPVAALGSSVGSLLALVWLLRLGWRRVGAKGVALRIVILAVNAIALTLVLRRLFP